MGDSGEEAANALFSADSRLDPARYTHIFEKESHNLGDLVQKFGSEADAFNAVDEAAQSAFKAGQLAPNVNGILPKGDLGHIINVGGMNVRLIGGRVIDGRVFISSFSRYGF